MVLPQDPVLARLAGNEIDARMRRRDQATLPQPGFDIRDSAVADPDTLRRVGLTSRPDPGTNARRYRSWEAAYFPMPRFIHVRPEDLEIQTAFLLARGGAGGGTLSGATAAIGGRWGTSRNWSCAVIAARDGGRFTGIEARWTVPAAARPTGAANAAPPGGVWKQSVWIGLDGYRLCSRSLPQVGTASLFDPDKADPTSLNHVPNYAGEHYLWVQWWVRDAFYGEAKVKGFDVAEGDRIRAELEVQPNGNVRFVVTNSGNVATNPQPVAVTIDWAAGSYLGDGGLSGLIVPEGVSTLERGHAPVEGRHAVWCVERPSVMPPSHEIPTTKPHEVESYMLPEFGHVVFTDALAAMTLPDGTVVERDMTAARRIRMIDPDRTALRVAVATTPQQPAPAGYPLPFARDALPVDQR